MALCLPARRLRYTHNQSVPSLLNTANIINGENTSGTLFPSIPLGDPDLTRAIVVCATAFSGLGVPGGSPTMTLNGDRLTEISSAHNQISNNSARVHIYGITQAELSNPYATFGDVFINYGGQHRKHASFYRLTGMSLIPFDIGSSVASDPLTDTINFPDLGAIIAGAKQGNNTSATWTGINEDFEGDTFGRMSTASIFPAVPGSTAVTCQFAATVSAFSAMAVAAFPLLG